MLICLSGGHAISTGPKCGGPPWELSFVGGSLAAATDDSTRPCGEAAGLGLGAGFIYNFIIRLKVLV